MTMISYNVLQKRRLISQKYKKKLPENTLDFYDVWRRKCSTLIIIKHELFISNVWIMENDICFDFVWPFTLVAIKDKTNKVFKKLFNSVEFITALQAIAKEKFMQGN